jgi:hypothetical protein
LVKKLKAYLLKAKTLNTPQKAAPLLNIKRGIFINKQQKRANLVG